MPTHYLIALAIALVALLASVTAPSPRPDPYVDSPLLVGSDDTMRASSPGGAWRN
jgi:hypothetical protein